MNLSTKLIRSWLPSAQTNFYTKLLSSLFSTSQSPYSSSLDYSALHSRIERIRDPRASILPVLEQWVSAGNPIAKSPLQHLVRLLKDYRRFYHALQISKWMTDRRYFTLSPSDAAIRLDLIHRVYGAAHAHDYFEKLSVKLKTDHVYGALLGVFVRENSYQKAEAVMQEMREKGMAVSSFSYNILINLYSKSGDFEKICLLIQEMEKNKIPPDRYTMLNLMTSYVTASNISGMERILNHIEENPQLGLGWKVYSLAATGYLKVGSIDKALTMLRKMEGMMPHQRKTAALNFLLTHYAETGKKDELHRVWNTYKPLYELTDALFCTMISSLSKVDDIEGAEKIFTEWESQCAMYDFRVLNRLLVAYCRKGLLEKAEAAVAKAVEGRTPYASTWHVIAIGYIEQNQMAKAIETLKKAILVSRKDWRPNPNTLTACLDYLEAQGNVEEMEEIIKLLKNLEIFSRDLYHRLVRTYIAAGKSETDVKIDDFAADEGTH